MTTRGKRHPCWSALTLQVLLALVALIATPALSSAAPATAAPTATRPPPPADAPAAGAPAAAAPGTVTPMAFGISDPQAITTGPDGNLWFINFRSQVIGRMTPTGTFTGFRPAGLWIPIDITTGPDGNLWLANGNSIGRMTTAGALTVFKSPAVQAPRHITTGPDGALWFTDSTTIGRITTAGAITTFPATGFLYPQDIVNGPDGNLWFTTSSGDTIGRLTPAGVFTPFVIPGLGRSESITVGPDGNLWFAQAHGIGRLTPTGTYTAFDTADTADAYSVASGADGAVWYVTWSRQVLGRIATDGTTTVWTDPSIINARGITNGPDGNLWFTANEAAHRSTTAGALTTFVGPGIQSPTGLTPGPDGNLWFTNVGFWDSQTTDGIGRITPAGAVTMFTDPAIQGPSAITTGADGALWFTNGQGNSIGRITTAGAVTSFTAPGVFAPQGIVAGPDGNLWFTNYSSNAVGRITTAGTITIFSDPTIDKPTGIDVGPDGNLWFANYGNSSLGVVTTTGAVTNVTDPLLKGPRALSTAPDGTIWIANTEGKSILKLALGTGFSMAAPTAWKPQSVVGLADSAWFTDAPFSVGVVTPTLDVATFTSPSILRPQSIVVGPDGDLWVTDVGTMAINKVAMGTPVTGSTYHPLAPKRVVDSRSGLGWLGPVVAGSPRNLTSLASAGVPPTAKGVVLNVTATNSSAGSFLTVTGAGGASPLSNLNFGPGQTIANLVTVATVNNQPISFTTKVGSVDVIADLVGYYDSQSLGSGARYTPTNPIRAVDTRTSAAPWNTKLGPYARDLVVRAPAFAAVPATATAVAANITVTNATQGSFVTAWPSGAAKPNASTINFAPGQTIANLAIVKIGSNGAIRLANAVGVTDVVVDIVGWFDPTSGDYFHPIQTPLRLLDDRSGIGLSGPWGPGQTRTLDVTRPTLPPVATAVVLNMTATNATTGTYLTVFPTGGPTPTASTLNVGSTTIANAAISGVGAGGDIDIANALGTVDVIADAFGYFAPT